MKSMSNRISHKTDFCVNPDCPLSERVHKDGLCLFCFSEKLRRERLKQLERNGWTPTTAMPGTVEKLHIMEQRAAMGFPIFHPGDVELELEADSSELLWNNPSILQITPAKDDVRCLETDDDGNRCVHKACHSCRHYFGRFRQVGRRHLTNA